MKRKKTGLIFILSGLFGLMVAIMAGFAITGYHKADFPQSYLPDHEAWNRGGHIPDNEIVKIENPWYTLKIYSSGSLTVNSRDNKPILSGMAYHANYDNHNEILILDNIIVNKIADSAVVLSGEFNEISDVTITIVSSHKDPGLRFKVKTQYHDSVVVIREAIIADYDIPVTEVYLKNRKAESNPGNKEYWLDKQGVRLGTGNRSSLIYNQQEISSLQLDSRKSRVVINLDYSLDQPFIEIPFQADGAGRWSDRSASAYKPGDERTTEFTILFGQLPLQTPRPMLVPAGYLAAYVFTEHADAGNVRTHRAAYFGDENITDIRMANGGFAGHEIPVTKSVFFEYLDGGIPDNLTIEDDSEKVYLDFLDQLYQTGLYDLCLHTPDESNSNRRYMQAAISAMKTRYSAESWIDHGMFPGNNNREAMVADGLNPESEFYSADLWEQYGTRFFWSPAVEAIRFSKPGPSIKDDFLSLRFSDLSAELWRRYRYRKNYLGETAYESLLSLSRGHFPMFELNSLQPLKGSAMPTPLYWQNETISESIYSWSTEYVYHGLSNINTDRQLQIEKRQLDFLVKDRGVFFNHGYYVRNGVDDNIILNRDGRLMINPLFDQILAYMDSQRDKGDLFLTTVKDLLNYWLLLENVRFDYKTDGTIDIFNGNDKDIKGLSMAVGRNSGRIYLDGNEPASRIIEDDLIIWFDIPAKSRRTLSFADHI
jgi:hypothetical protein